MFRTRFEPKDHGFHFNNGTFSGAFSVLCGGMSYAALDYFKCNMKIPEVQRAPTPGKPLHDYLYRRQVTAHYYTWHLFSGAWTESLPIIGAVTSGLSQGSFGEVESYLQSQGPLVMCLYGDITVGHHVLAIGCDPSTQTIELYDNNHRDRRSSLTGANGAWKHSSGSTWKGWFLDWGHYSDGTKFPPLAGRLCTKCHGLYATSFGKVGSCSAGGLHSPDITREYFLPCFVSEGQRGWRLCSKCNTLFFCPSGQATGWCADGSTHAPLRMGGKLLDFGVVDRSDKEAQRNWHQCKLCFGLFWAGRGNGNCPIAGTHEKSGRDYAVDYCPS